MIGQPSRCPPARQPGLKGVALAFIVLLGGCNKPQVATTETYVGARMARPDRILVQAFAITPDEVQLDQGVLLRAQRANSDVPLAVQKLEVARTAQSTLADAMVKMLRGYGLPAERGSGGGAPAVGSALLVEGRIIAIDQGNRTRRTVVGLGAGKSSLSAAMQLFMADGRAPPLLLNSFSGSGNSGRMPGMAGPMAVGGVGGHLLASTVVGSALHVRSESDGGPDDGEATNLAKVFAVQIGQFAVSQGWVPPGTVKP